MLDTTISPKTRMDKPMYILCRSCTQFLCPYAIYSFDTMMNCRVPKTFEILYELD